MTIFKKICPGILMLSLFSGLGAQNQDDALLFSRFDLNGTARYNAMGGAYNALGGDFSAIHVNPAAVGVFRKSRMGLSMYLNLNNTTATHFNTDAFDAKNTFKISNVGFVIANNRNKSKWRNSSFGVSFSKLTEFNQNIHVSGVNPSSSLLDMHRDDIADRGINNADPFGALLSWDSYLIDVDTTTGDFFSQIQNYNQKQDLFVEKKGDMREVVIAYGGNYDDKLYIGGSLGLLSARYQTNEYYSETVSELDTLTLLNQFNFQNNLSSSGGGVRASIGAIYRPHKSVRLGASINSGANLNISDDFFTSVNANYDTINYSYDAPTGSFDYVIRTPFRANAGLSYIFRKYGLISVDYGYVNFNRLNMRSDPREIYAFHNENNAIKTLYKAQHTLRVGLEARLNPVSLRLGYSQFGNTLQDGFGDNSFERYSAGIGFTKKVFYADFSGSISSQNSTLYLYDPSYIQASRLTSDNLRFILSFGFRF